MAGDFRMVHANIWEKPGDGIPDAPWCWNIYQHLPEQNHPNVGKYTIHGAYGNIISSFLETKSFFGILGTSLVVPTLDRVATSRLRSGDDHQELEEVFHFRGRQPDAFVSGFVGGVCCVW